MTARARALAARLRPDLAPLRHSRDFRLLYVGRAAGSAGAEVCYVAMPFQAYAISHSSLIVGLLSCAELLPLLGAGLVGGALADAVERRGVIVVSQVVAALAITGLAVNAVIWHALWILFALAIVLAGATGVQRPSVEVLVPALVGGGDLHGASSLTGMLGTAVYTVGPLAAGGLLTAGLPVAYLAATGACAAAAVPFGLMRRQPPTPGADRPSLRGIADGLRYARTRSDLLGSYLIDIGAMFFGAPYAVFPQIAAGLGGPAVLGLLYAAPGLGAFAVSVTSGWTRHVRRHGRAIALAVCGWGLAIAGFGFAPDLPAAVGALAVAGGADMVSGLFRMTLWNQTIPAAVRGRLAGLEMISYTTGEPLGNAETGALAALSGSVRLAVVSGGVLSIAGAVIVCLALPGLWRYDAGQAGVGTGEPASTAADPATPSLAASSRHQSCPDSGSV